MRSALVDNNGKTVLELEWITNKTRVMPSLSTEGRFTKKRNNIENPLLNSMLLNKKNVLKSDTALMWYQDMLKY